MGRRVGWTLFDASMIDGRRGFRTRSVEHDHVRSARSELRMDFCSPEGDSEVLEKHIVVRCTNWPKFKKVTR